VETWRKWRNKCPRESGWYWVDTGECDYVFILEVEGRDAKNDGWVWLDNSNRYLLTKDIIEESGERPQSNEWIKWEWAGPIPYPDLCEGLPAPSPGGCSEG